MWIWIPLALAGVAIAWRTRVRWVGVIALTIITLLVWQGSSEVRTQPGLLYMIQYLAIQLGLGFLFGRTLLAGREPLVTRFARLVHGQLPAEIERYTRRVTWAWTLFFGGVAASASGLFLGASVESWSIFVNILTPVLVALMFAGEYLIRRLSFPGFQHASIAAGVQAFQRALEERESR
jgi:uncharacterized membrane protein